MRKTITIHFIITALVLLGFNNLSAQNIFSLEPVKVLGAMNSYDTSSNSNTVYRRLSVTSGNPTDGRGQWVKTYNVQSSGGNFVPVNMTGGTNNGFLFISGPATNRFANKWTFLGTGSATLNAINAITAYNSGNDMGLNLNTAGRYTFVFNDAGYTNTNAKFYVGYTAAIPITISNVSQTVNTNRTATINITTSATPSSGENIYVRYTSAADFSSSNTSSIVQATGSGTSWSATIPAQNNGTTIKYYVFTSTASSISSMTEIDKSLVALNYNDNAGANYSYTINQKGISRFSTSTPVICGTSTSYTVSIIGTDTFSSPYQWQYINSNDSTLSATNDVTTQTLGNKTQSNQYKLWRRISRVGTSNPDTSNWVLVRMNPLPTASISGTTTVCRNSSSPNITFTGASGTAPYTFTYNINGGSNTTLTTSSGSSVTVSAPTTTTGIFTYNLVSVQDASSTACSQSQSGSATITVISSPTITNSNTATICSGASPNITLTASASSTFAWTLGTNTGSITGASASNGSTINQTLTNPSNANAGSIVFKTVATSTANGCKSDTSLITITVNPTPAITNSITSTICSGASTNITLAASAASTFMWTLGTNTGSITGASASNGASINQTLTNPSNANVGSIIYNVTPTSTTGSCVGNPTAITVIVNPRPAITNSSTASICSGTSPNLTLTANISSTFAWILGTNTGSIAGASASNGDSLNQILTNPSSSNIGSIIYIITPTTSNGSCVGNPTAITVTVNPRPTVTISNTSTICSGASPNITLTASAASTFAWTLGTNTGAISGASASNGSTINQTLTNPSNANVGSIIYKTVATSNTNGCKSDTSLITITVNPIPAITNSSTTTICSGTSTNLTLAASTTSTFAWTLGTNTGSISGASVSNGSSINQTLNNPSNVNIGSIVYNITPTSTTGSCVGSPSTLTVTVNPLPIYNGDRAQTICSGNSTNLLLSSTTVGGLNTYTFTSGFVNGITGNLADSSTNSIAQNLISSNSLPTWVKYNVTPKFMLNSVSCTGSSVIDSVLVNPLPSPTIIAPNSICANSTNTISTNNNSSNVFLWNITGGNIISGQGTSNINVNWGNGTNATILLKDSIKETGCVANTSKNISILPLPNASFTFIQSHRNVTFTPKQSGLTYKWYFGDGDSSNVQNPVHVYKTNGNYLVKLKVLSTNLCEKDTTISVSCFTPFQTVTANVGELALSISNAGTVGKPNARVAPNQLFSMRYPKTGGIEHLFEAGIWIGAKVNDTIRVSTTSATSSAGFSTEGNGFEFTQLDSFSTRSSLQGSPIYSIKAISHQDFITSFTDSFKNIPGTSFPINGHINPLGACIKLESYAWNKEDYNNFVIFNYELTNCSNKRWDSIWIGNYSDLVVRNVLVTRETGSLFFQRGRCGIDGNNKSIYSYLSSNFADDRYFNDTYGATQFLGLEWRNIFFNPDKPELLTTKGYPKPKINYGFWTFGSNTQPWVQPNHDFDMYNKMQNGITANDTILQLNPGNPITGYPSNWMQLLSFGPIVSLEPNEKLNFSIAYACAKQTVSILDSLNPSLSTPASLVDLSKTLNNAKTVYLGEDKDADGILKPQNDLNSNGKLERFLLPSISNGVKNNSITFFNIYPNPTSGIFTISSNQVISNINVFDVTGKLVYSQQNNTKQTNTGIDLSAFSNGIYSIHAKTENGEVSKSKVVVSK